MRRNAFTLVEIIVVIVLVAVLSGMTLLSLAGATASAALKESAGRLLRTAQYGQAYAVTRATHCRLVFDAEHGRFQLEREKDPVAEPGVWEPITADGVRAFTLPRGVTFGPMRIEAEGQQAPAIIFTPHGEATPAAIVLTDNDESFTVRIAGATGRAELVAGATAELLEERYDLDAM